MTSVVLLRIRHPGAYFRKVSDWNVARRSWPERRGSFQAVGACRERSPLDPALYWRNISRAIQIISAQLRTKRSCLFCFGEASARQAPVDFSVRMLFCRRQRVSDLIRMIAAECPANVRLRSDETDEQWTTSGTTARRKTFHLRA